MITNDTKIMNFEEANKHYRWYCEAREVCTELDFILDHITKGDEEDGKDKD